MSEHWTPGPWHAHYIGVWQIDAAMDAVATTQFCYAPETKANARLIAAAPDLYIALDALVQHGFAANWFCEPEDVDVVKTASLALAKARGEAP